MKGSSGDPKIRNSMFFYYLADPVAGALKNNNGWVSAEEVFSYVSEKFRNIWKSDGGYQIISIHNYMTGMMAIWM